MTTYTFRVDNVLKDSAFNVIKTYGLTPAQAINMFLNEIANTKSIPLSLDYIPTAGTIRAIEEVESGKAERIKLSTDDDLAKITIDLASNENSDV
ncbi:type II toxin-antitoxin system RelB/DinJ family antitoxin [Pasteurella multocida]|uniref:type II toxin-antitoxin system RelB/DinJ family antitoxin n=1 Tax=Pasteurella multocida TaxID=747 RepID=UPI003978762B